MFCNHCGASISEGSAFCSICGNAVNSVNSNNNPNTHMNSNNTVNATNQYDQTDIFANNPAEYMNIGIPTAKQKKSLKKTLAIIISVVLALLIVAGAVTFFIITGNPAYKISNAIKNSELLGIMKTGSAYDVNFKIAGDYDVIVNGSLQIKDGDICVNNVNVKEDGEKYISKLKGKLSTSEKKCIVDYYDETETPHCINYNGYDFGIKENGKVVPFLIPSKVTDTYERDDDYYSSESLIISVVEALVSNEGKNSAVSNEEIAKSVESYLSNSIGLDIDISSEQIEHFKKEVVKNLSNEKWLEENLGFKKVDNTYSFNIKVSSLAKSAVKIATPIIWDSLKESGDIGYDDPNDFINDSCEAFDQLDKNIAAINIELVLNGNRFEKISFRSGDDLKVVINISRQGNEITYNYSANIYDYDENKGSLTLTKSNEKLEFNFSDYDSLVQEYKKSVEKYNSEQDYDDGY